MIEIADSRDQRPDIISYCDNCGCISASTFIQCPDCGHNNLKKKQIVMYHHDTNEKQYPVKVITVSELIDNFIPADIAENLSEKQMLYIVRKIETAVEKSYRESIKGIVEWVIKNV